MDINIEKIGYTKNADLKPILEDGIKTAKECECDSFEYKVAEINGYEVKVVVEPKLGSFDSVCVDGVDGFGYSMAFEKD